MRVLEIVAGAGGMYCGSCLHSNTLARALREQGIDVMLVPVYTPLRTDEESAASVPVAFGGISVYLQQLSPIFRHAPRWLDRLLDHPRVIDRLTRNAGGTQPEKLGPMTVSMLRGEEGNQRREFGKLLAGMEPGFQPDVIHLSNMLLAGMARPLARHFKAPVVCTLSGEDIFLDRLPEPWKSQARELLAERCGEMAALVAMNGYYADAMAAYLGLGRERVHVVRPGLDLAGHATPEVVAMRSARRSDSVTIGYFARICHEKGLHLLVEAFGLLAASQPALDLRLRVGGYLGAGDRTYFETVRRRAGEVGVAERFEHVGELDRKTKIAFLQSLDVMSVPTVYRESKGLSIVEAWANGVPCVLPDHGAFPEMVAHTGGGLLHAPGDPASLADALRRLATDRELAHAHARRAHGVVHEHYHARRMADDTRRVYESVIAR